MKVRILGCSGGIGGRHLRTTSILVDHDILIDAGTGVCELSLAELALIDHVFITHSHLDHLAALPLLIDSVADLRDHPLIVYATAETLEILRRNIFNWLVWPDFSQISVRGGSAMSFRPIRVGERIALGERTIGAVPAVHSVPAVGYHLDSGVASLVFTGDTTVNDVFWPVVNAIPDLRYLIIETAFSNREEALAVSSAHLCPKMLGRELDKLSGSPEVFVSHLKPGQIETIMDEIEQAAHAHSPVLLQNNQVFEF